MQLFHRITAACAAVATTLLGLVACDQQRINALEEGLSTEADVRKAFGEPETIWQSQVAHAFLSIRASPWATRTT